MAKYYKMSNPQISCGDASKRTLANRCREMETIRDMVHGPGGDSHKLLGVELKALPASKRQEVLEVAGVSSAKPPPKLGLELKAELNWTTSCYRKFKRYIFIICINFTTKLQLKY